MCVEGPDAHPLVQVSPAIAAMLAGEKEAVCLTNNQHTAVG